MITIRDIEISRFRSIREAKLANLQDFSVLAGLNNSGKSNFLRALNLFFTGRPEPELPFNLARDYYRGELSAKKKKNWCRLLLSAFIFSTLVYSVTVMITGPIIF